MANFLPTVTRDSNGFLTLHWPTNQRGETMVAREVMVQMVDDLNRLRAAGDKLAEAHIDDLCDCDQPECVTIREAHAAWQEARRG